MGHQRFRPPHADPARGKHAQKLAVQRQRQEHLALGRQMLGKHGSRRCLRKIQAVGFERQKTRNLILENGLETDEILARELYRLADQGIFFQAHERAIPLSRKYLKSFS